MTTITTRSGKGSPLTNNEVDANFTNLNDDKVEASGDSMTGDLSFGDNNKVILGSGNDLQIYHDGTHSYIDDTGTGNLKFKSNGNKFNFVNGSDQAAMYIDVDAETKLYYNVSEKLATTSTGIDVTGSISADGLTVDVTDQVIINHSGDGGGIRIDSTNGTNTGSLRFGDDLDNYIGAVEYNHSTNTLSLYADNATRVAVNSSGIDVTGSVTADSLTVDGQADFESGASLGSGLNVNRSGHPSYGIVTGGNTEVYHAVKPNGGSWQTYMKVTDGGDIGFYNSAGTSQDLYWDASTSRLGLGETNPAGALHIHGGSYGEQFISSSNSALRFVSTGGVNYIQSGTATSSSSAADLIFTNVGGSGETMRITSAGNVGIGTTSPSFGLSVESDNGSGYAALFRKSSSDPALAIQTTSGVTQIQGLNSALNATYGIAMQVSGGNVGIGTTSPSSLLHLKANAPYITFEDDDNNQDWQIQATAWFAIRDQSAGQERLRIDSSGNLLVGTTSTSASVAGGRIFSTGRLVTSVDDEGHYFRRNNSDGTIVEFAKDGTTVGTIGVEGSDLTIGTGDTGLQFRDASDAIRPFNISTNAARDANIDLGRSSERFRDLYLSGGAYLGGTAAANKLDDYEEGTFTPVLADASTGGNAASGTSVGEYTKIGQQVFLSIHFYNINTTGLTSGNDIFIQSLPFTSKSITGSAFYTGTMYSSVLSFTSTENCYPIINDNTSFLRLGFNRDGAGFDAQQINGITSGQTDISINISYMTA